MTAIAARRRRRTWYALAAGVLVVALIPVLGVAAWRAIRDTESARDVTSTATEIPVTPTALLAGVDDSGQLTTLAMLAIAPDGAGGSIVAVPVGASVTGEDGTRQRLADAYAEGGLQQLETDFESVMLVNIDLAQEVDEAQLAALLAPVGDLQVNLPADAEQGAAATSTAASPTTTAAETSTTTRRSSTSSTTSTTTTTAVPDTEVVASAGEQTMTSEQAAGVLLASVDGQSETTRMPNTAAIWDAVSVAVGAGRPGLTPVDLTSGGPTDLTGYTNALWAGPVGTWQMGATPITDPAQNPDGADLLQIDLAESIMVVATVAPSAASAVLDGASVQLTTGFTDWTVTRDAVALLAYNGANVMVVINTTEPPPATTEVLIASESSRALAEVYAEALGVETVGVSTAPVEGIEVQITLGQDFADQRASGATPTLESIPSPRDTVDKNEATTTTVGA